MSGTERASKKISGTLFDELKADFQPKEGKNLLVQAKQKVEQAIEQPARL